jgi:hypothetical protein
LSVSTCLALDVSATSAAAQSTSLSPPYKIPMLRNLPAAWRRPMRTWSRGHMQRRSTSITRSPNCPTPRRSRDNTCSRRRRVYLARFRDEFPTNRRCNLRIAPVICSLTRELRRSRGHQRLVARCVSMPALARMDIAAWPWARSRTNALGATCKSVVYAAA